MASWCDTGLIESHRTPGGHRRIARTTLLEFAEARGVSLPSEVQDRPDSIVIVDDERDFAEMLRDYLVLKGLDVRVAHTAFQAGVELGRRKPDLLLLDLNMSDADAFEVLRLMRGDEALRDVRVLACTTFRDSTLDARVAREAFDGFIEKPLNMSSLLDLVQRTLHPSGEPNRTQ